MARDIDISPTSAEEKVITGLMWPPDTGKTARIRMVSVIAMRIDIIKFGILTSLSRVEITTVSNIKTRTAEPKSSPTDARHTYIKNSRILLLSQYSRIEDE